MNVFNSIKSYFANKASAHNLAQMDAHQLNDLGLNRGDLFDARFMDGASRSAFFATRRNHIANVWVN